MRDTMYLPIFACEANRPLDPYGSSDRELWFGLLRSRLSKPAQMPPRYADASHMRVAP